VETSASEADVGGLGDGGDGGVPITASVGVKTSVEGAMDCDGELALLCSTAAAVEVLSVTLGPSS
jgi:hypothetical protein